MKVSVVIATYNREECLVNSIESVLGQDFDDFELLVVDQTRIHTPQVEYFLGNQRDPRFRYFLIQPPSLPGARNFGLAHAQGEIIVYVDDDVLLGPEFIAAHWQAHNDNSEIGAVAGRIHTSGTAESENLFAYHYDGNVSGGYDYPFACEAQSVQGCNMSFHRILLKDLGGFDTGFQGNALREESDVCFRLRAQGSKIRYEPRAALDHLVAADGGCREIDLYDGSLYYQNETLFFLKNMPKGNIPLFLFEKFRCLVWPLKGGHYGKERFARRLWAYFWGSSRGIWLAVFPDRLVATIVWESPSFAPPNPLAEECR